MSKSKAQIKTLNILIISDATGATAESVLTATQVHFKGTHFNIKRFPFTKTVKQLKDILAHTEEGKCIIIFTLVSPKLRKILSEQSEKKHLTLIDVMGPLVDLFSDVLKHSPKLKQGALKRPDEEMFRVTEAIHFALTHDDGLGLDDLEQADLIIFGVSRTGKTPTSIYLSCRKLKVANIPIIQDVPIPKNILRLPAKKVGFLINAERLVQLRTERATRMEIPGYSSKANIRKEIDYCESVYSKIPLLWTTDVTNRTIEETSEWITHNVL